MKPLREFDTVRVLRSVPERHLRPPGLREPRAGDVGTVIDIRENGTDGVVYLVEKVAPDGYTVWLGDFHRTELEWISTPDGSTP
jgi:hypothetical protein